MTMNNCLVTAHRGSPDLYPENTLPSFRKAAALPVDAIEFDVHLSRDHKLVVTHDDLIDRCSNGHGRVDSFTLAELRRFDFGSWKGSEFAGLQIPTLEEVIQTIRGINPAMRLLIEVKEDSLECASALLDFLRKRDLLGNCMLDSFNYAVLAFLRKAEPTVKLLASESSESGDPDGVSAVIDWIGVWEKYATPERIRYYHDKGIKVDSWVIDDADALKRVVANGTDSITTNTPELLCRLLGR